MINIKYLLASGVSPIVEEAWLAAWLYISPELNCSSKQVMYFQTGICVWCY